MNTLRGFLPYDANEGTLIVFNFDKADASLLGDAAVPDMVPPRIAHDWREVAVNCHQESPETSHLLQIWLVGDEKGYASCTMKGIRCIPLFFSRPAGTSWPVVKSARITIEPIQ